MFGFFRTLFALLIILFSFRTYSNTELAIEYFKDHKIIFRSDKNNMSPEDVLYVIYEAGLLKNGPLDKHKYVIIHLAFQSACGKHGGEQDILGTFRQHNDSNDFIAVSDGCDVFKYGAIFGDTIKIDNEHCPDKKIGPYRVICSKDFKIREGYAKVLKNITIGGKKLALKAEDYNSYIAYAPLVKHFSMKGEKIIYEENGQKIFPYGRWGYLLTPDNILQRINIGLLLPSPDGYYYSGFFESIAKWNLKLKESNYEKYISDGKYKEKFLKAAYQKYSTRFDDLYKEYAAHYKEYLPNESFPEKSTYKEYKENKPFEFIKDLIGQVQVFTKAEHYFPQLAEPVIYLYPTKKMKVDIKIGNSHLFYKTIPEYKNGWSVTADPSSSLSLSANERPFKYLFWEAKLMPILNKKYGWVVHKSDVESFFDKKMKKLGMNDYEIADLKRYWLPRMQFYKYYHIWFLGNSFINFLFPITTSPNYKSLLRVHFVARGINKKISMTPQKLDYSFERKGFSIVEWGGVLYE